MPVPRCHFYTRLMCMFRKIQICYIVEHCWKNLLNDFVSDVYHPSGESYLLTVLKQKRDYTI